MNVFIFFGTLYSLQALVHADPELYNWIVAGFPRQTTKPVATGQPMPEVFGDAGSQKTLAVFFNTCLGCNSRNLIYLNRLSDSLKPHGFRVVLITRNPRAEVTPLLEAKTDGKPFLRCAFVSDSDRKIVSALGVQSLPSVVIFEAGRSVWATPSDANWFGSLQAHLEQVGAGKAIAGVTADTKTDEKALESVIAACTVKSEAK